MEKLAYSIPEVAELLGISVPTAYALTKSEDFPVLHIGKRKVVPKQGLEEWIKQKHSIVMHIVSVLHCIMGL